MKYFVISKCRLTDLNKYLIPNQIFVPKDDEYERTSRSLAAALRAGWVRKATAKEIESFEKNGIVKVQSKPNKEVTLAVVDMTPESFADEVISSDDILKARDKRRAEATTNLPEVTVTTEDIQQEEVSQEISQVEQTETNSEEIAESDDLPESEELTELEESNEISVSDSQDEAVDQKSNEEEIAGIKKEIEKKAKKLKKKKS